MSAEGVVVCIPVFDDWEAAWLLVDELDQAAAALEGPVSVLLVDDGSREPPPAALPRAPARLARVEVLSLRRNLGHQRAIALGLTFIYENRPCAEVVVMDGDGQDAPADAVTLVARARREPSPTMVFARRARHAEGLVFRAGYVGYRILHRALTGRGVEVGNFSVVPFPMLARIVGISEIWNHYAAGVYQARLPIVEVPIPRRPRSHGESKMGFTSLVTHGLSAISVYGETVGVRLLCLTSALIALGLLAIAGSFATRLLAPSSAPVPAAALFGLLLVLFFGLCLLTLAVLFTLRSRDRYSFLPLRDYGHYLAGVRSLHE